jgi:hypothetical protein
MELSIGSWMTLEFAVDVVIGPSVGLFCPEIGMDLDFVTLSGLLVMVCFNLGSLVEDLGFEIGLRLF